MADMPTARRGGDGGTYSGDGESLGGVTAIKQNTTVQETSTLQQLFPGGRDRLMVPAKLSCSIRVGAVCVKAYLSVS